MNKNRKRAISRGKFTRVRSIELSSEYDHEWDNSVWFDGELCVAHAGFFYWSNHDIDTGTVKYFRKSIKEALA
jgi:hypothetical protein